MFKIPLARLLQEMGFRQSSFPNSFGVLFSTRTSCNTALNSYTFFCWFPWCNDFYFYTKPNIASYIIKNYYKYSTEFLHSSGLFSSYNWGCTLPNEVKANEVLSKICHCSSNTTFVTSLRIQISIAGYCIIHCIMYLTLNSELKKVTSPVTFFY